MKNCTRTTRYPKGSQITSLNTCIDSIKFERLIHKNIFALLVHHICCRQLKHSMGHTTHQSFFQFLLASFSFWVQTQAFELVYEFYNDVALAQRAPEGRLISCRTVFALYNEYLTPYMLQTIKTVNGTLKCCFQQHCFNCLISV